MGNRCVSGLGVPITVSAQIARELAQSVRRGGHRQMNAWLLNATSIVGGVSREVSRGLEASQLGLPISVAHAGGGPLWWPAWVGTTLGP